MKKFIKFLKIFSIILTITPIVIIFIMPVFLAVKEVLKSSYDFAIPFMVAVIIYIVFLSYGLRMIVKGMLQGLQL